MMINGKIIMAIIANNDRFENNISKLGDAVIKNPPRKWVAGVVSGLALVWYYLLPPSKQFLMDKIKSCPMLFCPHGILCCT